MNKIEHERRMWQELEESRQKYIELVDNLNSGMAVYKAIDDGRDFIFVDFNRAGEKIENISRDEVLGKGVLKVFPAVKEFGLLEVFQRVWRTGKPEHHPVTLYKDKRISGWRDNYVYKLPGGEIVAIFNDATELKKTEEKLRESEEKFAKAFDASPNLLSIISFEEGRIIEVNEAFCKLTGYELEECIGHTPAELNVWADMEQRNKIIQKVKEKGYAHNIEANLRTRSGEIRSLIISMEIITVGDDKYILSVATDITKRKQAEEALKDSEEKFSKVFRSCGNAICITSAPDNKFVEVNESFTWFTGYTREEVIGHSAAELKLWVHDEELKRFMGVLEGKGKFYNQEFSSRRKSGEIRIGLGSAENINIGGKPCRIVVITDITQRKRLEEKHRTILETALDGFVIIDLNANFIEVNDSYCQMLGYTREELLKMSVQNVEVLQSPEEITQRMKKMITQGPDHFETKHRRKDGRIIDIVVSSNYLDIEQGQFFVFLRDITERKKSEEALKKSEENFRRTLEDSPLGIRIVNSDDDTIYANRALLEIYGYDSIEEFRSIPVQARYTPESYAEYLIRKDKREHGVGKPVPVVISIIRKDGEIRYLETMRKEVLWNGERQYQIIYQDITKRKQAEEALRKSEENFRRTLEDSPLGIRIVNSDDKTIFVNRALLNIYGHSSFEELRNTPLKKRLTPESYAESQQRRKKRRRGESSPSNYETNTMRKDGEIRHLETLRKEVLWNGEIQYQLISQDVTERKQAEEALRKSEENFRRTLDDSPLGICIVNANAKTIYANRAMLTLYGYDSFEELKTIPLKKRYTPESYAEHLERIEKSQRGEYVPSNIEISIVRKNGEIRHLEVLREEVLWDGKTQHQMIYQDVTERKLLEAEHQKIEKLESLGTLAGGIAHDFNNLLTGIMGNISLARRYVEPNGKAIERLEEAEKASLRARDLTQQLLTFSRGGAPVKTLIRIDKLIQESASFALRGSKVKPEFSLPDGLWAVKADKGQINQVISNIVINADQAMPQGGTLNIEAKNLAIRSSRVLPLSPGNYVHIAIKDRGVGIPREHLSKIFDPFFTTKQKGCGLGLATVYSIVKNHDGHIAVESKLGTGTTFHIYLPASEKHSPAGEEVVEEAILRGKGRILVMDDEDIIREMLHKMLSLAGYEVELTQDGTEAIKRYTEAKEAKRPFDAVIMDLTIPGGMGGKEAITRLLEIDPNARVIVSSGYATDPIMSGYKKYGFRAILTKPYGATEIEKTLKRVLTRK